MPSVGTIADGSKPFVKWAGGKQAQAPSFAKLFPTRFRRYFEPFVGGGSVALAVAPPRAVISDANPWLIDAYLAIRDDWKRVARILDKLVNTRAEYLRIRRIPADELDLHRRAAHLIYLNKTCFRGLFRVNRDGKFNVPYGAYRRRYYDPDTLAAVARVLGRFEIRCGDFEIGLAGVTSADFVYLDPPYYKLGGYSDFDRYTPGKFRGQDHLRLAAVCRELDERGVRWALTNSDTPFVRSLFRGFRIIRVAARREINLDSSNRDISELLIANCDLNARALNATSPSGEAATTTRATPASGSQRQSSQASG